MAILGLPVTPDTIGPLMVCGGLALLVAAMIAGTIGFGLSALVIAMRPTRRRYRRATR